MFVPEIKCSRSVIEAAVTVHLLLDLISGLSRQCGLWRQLPGLRLWFSLYFAAVLHKFLTILRIPYCADAEWVWR